MKINLKFLTFLMISSAFFLSSFTLINSKKSAKTFSVDENIEVVAGGMFGPNDVTVVFTRTGPDAGLNDVYITYTLKFNEGTSGEKTETFTMFMPSGELTTRDHVRGPNPTAWVDVIDVNWTY